ncbi:MAG: alcohol dehydrogenase catalytic domain-containing protein [Clostridia bacterium]|nr:alcohol dehydrogenase catalytic domain-containing protein [Clostridia bacterium]
MKALKVKDGRVSFVRCNSPTPSENGVACRPVHLSISYKDIMSLKRDGAIGTEAIGKIVEVGESVEGVSVGDLVIVPSGCVEGVFAEYFLVENANESLVKVPRDTRTDELIPMCHTIPYAFSVVEGAELNFGDNVAIFSNEAEGLFASLASKHRGVAELILLSSHHTILEYAPKFGTTNVVSTLDCDIKTALSGKVIDKAIILEGDNATLREALSIVKQGGEIICCDGEIDITRELIENEKGIRIRELEITVDKDRVERAMRLLTSNRLMPGEVITHTQSGLDSIESGIELAKSKPRGYIKLVINV